MAPHHEVMDKHAPIVLGLVLCAASQGRGFLIMFLIVSGQSSVRVAVAWTSKPQMLLSACSRNQVASMLQTRKHQISMSEKKHDVLLYLIVEGGGSLKYASYLPLL